MKRIEIFRTLFPHLDEIFSSSCVLQSFLGKKRKCRNAYLSSISAQYPGRDLNPHARDEHRILSPDIFPEISVKSALSLLHFKAKRDISAPYFRTSPTFHYLKNRPSDGTPIFHFLQTLKPKRHGNDNE